MLKPHTQKIFILITCLTLAWVVLTSAPISFKESTNVSISKGDSIKIIAQKLKDNNIIQSEFFFTNIVILFNLDSKIVAGDYIFKEAHSVFEVLHRISTGDYDINVKRVTIIEGLTVKEMAQIFAQEFYNISEQEFIEKALPYEGYLFPETYYFLENTTSEEIIQKMRTTFDEKISENKQILQSGWLSH